jgi:hypothetical protein
MLAISRDNQKVFLFEPLMGLSVPIVLDLDGHKIRVEIPEVEELEENFASVDGLEEIKDIVPSHGRFVDAGADFSRFYSREFQAEIKAQDITVIQLRELIGIHYSKIKGASAPLGGAHAKAPAFAALAKFEA